MSSYKCLQNEFKLKKKEIVAEEKYSAKIAMPGLFCPQAQSFHGELHDTLARLADIDGQLITTKPVGGMPETAKEQLEKFMVSRRWIVCYNSGSSLCRWKGCSYPEAVMQGLSRSVNGIHCRVP